MSSYTPSFQFSYPQQSNSPFAYQFSPQAIEAEAQNPNSSAAGLTSPTTLASDTFKNTEPDGKTSLMASGEISPQEFKPQVGVQNTPANSTNTNPINQNALSLFSQTAQRSGLGDTATSLINDFGTHLGFAANSADTAANLASFGIAPGASTEAAAAAADSTASFAAGTSDLGASTFGASLSGTLGAAGLGALGGGILAHALGENSTGGSIGGAVGAAAGYALGGAGAAALGLELGSFAGPIGAIVGGVGGAIFGGLFGNKSAPTNASSMYGSISPNGSLSNIVNSSKNPNGTSNSFTQSAQENFSSIAEAANTALGVQFDPNVHFSANYSSKHGGANIVVSNWKTNQSTGAISFNPQDPASTQQAYQKALSSAAGFSGFSDTDQLNSWYQNTYVNSTAGASNIPPTLPNNPVASQQQQSFQKFLDNYKAQQNANAAPVQTTVGTAKS